MCNPKPAPRCSNHAKVHMERAFAALNEATNSYNKVKNGRNEELKSQRTSEMYLKYNSYIMARREFFSSPQGIKHLKESFKASQNPDERESLTTEIELAHYNREKQMLAYKISQRIKKTIPADIIERRNHLAQVKNAMSREVSRMMDENADQQLIHQKRVELRKVGMKLHSVDESLGKHVAEKKNLVSRTIGYATSVKDKGFYYLPQSELDESAKYVPFGVYAKITDVKKEANGTYSIRLEGAMTRNIKAHDNIYIAD